MSSNIKWYLFKATIIKGTPYPPNYSLVHITFVWRSYMSYNSVKGRQILEVKYFLVKCKLNFMQIGPV